MYFHKKIGDIEGGFIILEEEGFINQQTRLDGGRNFTTLHNSARETLRFEIPPYVHHLSVLFHSVRTAITMSTTG